MSKYPFDLIRRETGKPLADPKVLAKRPFVGARNALATDASKFQPGGELATAINTALCVGEPLLVTGEPGTGKTQAAYYAAWKLGVDPLIHFQVKSDSTARDLLYHFDTVRYFQEAHLPGTTPAAAKKRMDKTNFVEKRALWDAFEAGKQRGAPAVVLIDEIDKAPRDFPNDLLHELDQMEFQVLETRETVTCDPAFRPIVFITSNSERRLPEPFLRRCVYHHIRFDDQLVKRAVEARRDEFGKLSDGFVKLALDRFFSLRSRSFRKPPATSELLVWLRVLAAAGNIKESALKNVEAGDLPYLGALLKDHQDHEDAKRR
ncbi:MAG: MoxR-like ATPase [Verrucomicrobiales bacterium]|jgi:MoxR-like ATPase